ncbi:hypothetical protein Mal15_20020 [Stieleria maiorica]|uniref:Uncharacterized protein n=1 Tax=Stieleria maiorica TaxID=2795974 RepID=A0A5B9MCK5_9BACT|nr:hypothetical protein [Stieleria maiorica]QEF97956.1 hypothetical protein Mal15_20020 [Stieleria maiorica]
MNPILVALILLLAALGGILCLMMFWRPKRRLCRAEVVQIIERFLSGEGGAYEWDDFLSLPIADPNLDRVRQQCVRVDWASKKGRESIERILAEIRGN